MARLLVRHMTTGFRQSRCCLLDESIAVDHSGKRSPPQLTMSKPPKQSPIPAPTHNGRPLVVWGEPHPEPKWDIYISALLAYCLRDLNQPEPPETDGDE